jgi:hypothetical protein
LVATGAAAVGAASCASAGVIVQIAVASAVLAMSAYLVILFLPEATICFLWRHTPELDIDVNTVSDIDVKRDKHVFSLQECKL